MTVEELIKALQELPKDAVVQISGSIGKVYGAELLSDAEAYQPNGKDSYVGIVVCY